MFIEYIYVCVCEQYNSKTIRWNTSKLKHSILIEKTKHLSKQNWQPWYKYIVLGTLVEVVHTKKLKDLWRGCLHIK